jgi:hypothetical protein
MSLVGLLIAVLVIGLIFYLIRMLPIAEPFKSAALVILIVLVIVWLLSGFGGLPAGIRIR